MSLEQEVRKADDVRRRAVEDAEESRQNSTRALVLTTDSFSFCSVFLHICLRTSNDSYLRLFWCKVEVESLLFTVVG